MNKKPLSKKNLLNILKKFKNKNKKTEFIKTIDSNNRILSENIISRINVPPFNNSAVDGYAIKNKDIDRGKFNIINKIVAGDKKNIKLKKFESVRIFTGARMPINSKTVIMQENTKSKNGYIYNLKKIKAGSNCRLAGEDVKKGKLIFKKRTLINPGSQSLLASIGLNKIKVYKKLSIGYFTSGNELNNPTTKLIGSQINNSNRFALNSLISNLGFKSTDLGVLKDDYDKFKNKILKKINKFDVIITTGGASVGTEDHLINVLRYNGKVIFWKIAIKPGRPLGFGLINQVPIICLPGNPVSVFLLFKMIIQPFLLKLAGSDWIQPKSIPAKINFFMQKKTNRLEWLRVNIEKNMNRELVVKKYPKQGSGIISSISFSDGIIEIPENISTLKPGDIFNFYPLFY